MERPFQRHHGGHRATINNHESKGPSSAPSTKVVPFTERIKHFTWAWFTLPMSTGGIALLLRSTSYSFVGLVAIGKVIYIFDIVLFLLLVVGITTRFILAPGSLQKSLTHPTESLFFPTAWLALVNIVGIPVDTLFHSQDLLLTMDSSSTAHRCMVSLHRTHG